MADRYTYLPQIGIFIMIAWFFAEFMPKWEYRKNVMVVSAVLAIIAMMIISQMQLRHWKNSFALFKRAVEVTENNYLMHNNYGNALLNRGKLDEAFFHFKETARINPNHEKAFHNMGIVARAKGDIDEAITYFEKALQLNPDYVNAHHKMGRSFGRSP